MLTPTVIYSAQPEHYTMSLNVAIQEKTNWCWAASAWMIGKKATNNSTRTQTNLVVYVKGSNVNQGGTLSESALAAKYMTSNSYSFATRTTPFTHSQIRTHIVALKPIYASAGYYNSSGVRVGGHAVVIYGYNYPDKIVEYIYYMDPWDGRSYYTTYNAFKNGSFNGRIAEGHVYR